MEFNIVNLCVTHNAEKKVKMKIEQNTIYLACLLRLP